MVGLKKDWVESLKGRVQEVKQEVKQRVEATAQVARATKAIPDWVGWRQFRVAAVIDEARDVKSFYFTPVDGRPLSPFLPGQYLTFRLPITRTDPPLVRCYSLSDRPRQDYYRVTIKRIAAPAGRAGLPPSRSSESNAPGKSHWRSRMRICSGSVNSDG